MTKQSPGKATLYVRLPAHLVAAIDRAADERLVSRSAVIRAAVAATFQAGERQAGTVGMEART